jgi:hypothetical protein
MNANVHASAAATTFSAESAKVRDLSGQMPALHAAHDRRAAAVISNRGCADEGQQGAYNRARAALISAESSLELATSRRDYAVHVAAEHGLGLLADA